MIMPSSQANGTSWIDGTPPPPRIFPGVVHERTRRGSLRQGSSSERDANVTNVASMVAPRSYPREEGDRGPQKVVVEEPNEPENREEALK